MHPSNVIVATDHQVSIFIMGCAAFTLTILAVFLDLPISEYLETKIHLYPCIKFHCFCGFTQHLSGRMPFTWTYCVYKVIRHTSRCLVWMMRFPELKVTYYYANEIAQAELSNQVISSIMMSIYREESAKIFRGEKKF